MGANDKDKPSAVDQYVRDTKPMRSVIDEDKVAEVGGSGAKSSVRKLYYHMINPRFLRRLAMRKTVGGSKYGPINSRAGVNDPAYVADRMNHLFSHMISFIEGDESDDHIGAMGWCLDFLCDVPREVIREVTATHTLTGESALKYNEKHKQTFRLAEGEKAEP